ncbi:hypothetical protein [Geobacter sp. DSM 9736]|uniref:hypothetical protein n=1 Tax=Geobacter sp. DSM 9736 TaxID=1277350 RepID=UPI000B503D49|nr:hypothetical protein [Geobacter sp. DSM 9736]SNB47551.1 hypothetical protein SAMN06269301_3041 [Geobacter sp. DSM 9736]
MLNIFLIASQPRLHQIVSEAATPSGAILRIATNLADGVAEIGNVSPSIIFLQSRLSGLSAEIIARHVRSHAPLGAKLVLFAEKGDSSAPGGELTVDSILDTTAEDAQISVAIRGIISETMAGDATGAFSSRVNLKAGNKDGVTAQNAEVDPRAGSGTDAKTGEDEAGFKPLEVANLKTAGGDADCTPLEAISSVSDSVSVKGEPAAPAAIAPSMAFKEELDSLLSAYPPSGPKEQETPFSAPTVDEVFSRIPAKKNNHAILAVSTLSLTAAALLFFIFNRTEPGVAKPTSLATPPQITNGQTKQPDKLPVTPVPAEVQPKTPFPTSAQVANPPTPQSLPGFIPREGVVTDYGRSNPGWEKYLSAAAEYKVYREASRIKALQVIDRSGNGLPRSFFTNVIHQMTGVRDYQLEAKEKKGRYLVKRGTLSDRARVIVYKRDGDTIIQAFVITFND